MMKKGCLPAAVIAVALVLFLVFSGSFYTVDQTEQVIITQFGKPVGDPITEPGLHFKTPLVQSVNSLDKRFLEWDGAPVSIPTSSIVSTAFSVSASESRYIVKVWPAGRTDKGAIRRSRELLKHPLKPKSLQNASVTPRITQNC